MKIIVGVKSWAIVSTFVVASAFGLAVWLGLRPASPPEPPEPLVCRSEARIICGETGTLWYCHQPQTLAIQNMGGNCILYRCACPGDKAP